MTAPPRDPHQENEKMEKLTDEQDREAAKEYEFKHRPESLSYYSGQQVICAYLDACRHKEKQMAATNELLKPTKISSSEQDRVADGDAFNPYQDKPGCWERRCFQRGFASGFASGASHKEKQMEGELAEAKRMMDAAVVVGNDFKKSFWEARAEIERLRAALEKCRIALSNHAWPIILEQSHGEGYSIYFSEGEMQDNCEALESAIDALPAAEISEPENKGVRE